MTNTITLDEVQLADIRPREYVQINAAVHATLVNETITLEKLKQREFLVNWAWRELRKNQPSEDDLFDSVFNVYHVECTVTTNDVQLIRKIVRCTTNVYKRYMSDTRSLGDLLANDKIDSNYILSQLTPS